MSYGRLAERQHLGSCHASVEALRDERRLVFRVRIAAMNSILAIVSLASVMGRDASNYGFALGEREKRIRKVPSKVPSEVFQSTWKRT